MKKTFMGVRLKRLREEQRLTQAALAGKLGISLSYLNQLENNQRPLTLPVLLALNSVFGLDVQSFAEGDEARLISDLREALADPSLGEFDRCAELRELALNMPAVGRALVNLNRKYRHAAEQYAAISARLGEDRQADAAVLPSTPFEEVRDFFYLQHNYIAELDEAAEAIAGRMEFPIGRMAPALAAYLESPHGVKLLIDAIDELGSGNAAHVRCAAPNAAPVAEPAIRANRPFSWRRKSPFWNWMRRYVRSSTGKFTSDEARGLARIGLANYFAGALILPYSVFLAEAERCRYDIELLSHRFGVGFETICHRLSTLQRHNARGVPFFFIRVDRAGNISKRQSATDFHFSRVGGTCPLWNVYEAFANPGRILTQLARMPDERTYLWIARTVSHGSGGTARRPRRLPSLSAAMFVMRNASSIRRASRSIHRWRPRSAWAARCASGPIARSARSRRSAGPSNVDETRSHFAPYATSLTPPIATPVPGNDLSSEEQNQVFLFPGSPSDDWSAQNFLRIAGIDLNAPLTLSREYHHM